MVSVTGLVAAFFLVMGLIALAVPERITAIFGTPSLTAEGRNEVRAVYGGYGLAMSVLLVVASGLPSIRRGVVLCVTAALAGMAGGRVLGAVLEWPRRFYPVWFYCALEAGMAAALYCRS